MAENLIKNAFPHLDQTTQRELQIRIEELSGIVDADILRTPKALNLLATIGATMGSSGECREVSPPSSLFQFVQGGKRYISCFHDEPHTYLLGELKKP